MKKKDNKKEYILEYDMNVMNIMSIVILVLMFVLTKFLLDVLPNTMISDLSDKILNIIVDEKFGMFMIFFVVMILWMVLHEIIHCIAYQTMGAKSINIVFGVALEKGVFYCKCREYINKKSIMVSLLAPFLVIGVFTYLLGFIISSSWLILLSIINISGASADLIMFSFFLKQDNDVEFKELGFSSPFCLRTRVDLQKKKFFGIKSIKLVEDPKETIEDFEEKVTITKFSWGVIIFIVVILIIDCLFMYFFK